MLAVPAVYSELSIMPYIASFPVDAVHLSTVQIENFSRSLGRISQFTPAETPEGACPLYSNHHAVYGSISQVGAQIGSSVETDNYQPICIFPRSDVSAETCTDTRNALKSMLDDIR
jgi:hypothetical protein